MTLKKYISLSEEKAIYEQNDKKYTVEKSKKPKIGKPYSQQPGRKAGKGAGHVINTTKESRDKLIAQQATGIEENPLGLGTFYDRSGRAIPKNEIGEYTFVEVPNAGAGSFKEVFAKMGYLQVIPWEQTSSAGDWSFVISKDEKEWFSASQDNRFPRYGFRYMISDLPFIESNKPLSMEEARNAYTNYLGVVD